MGPRLTVDPGGISILRLPASKSPAWLQPRLRTSGAPSSSALTKDGRAWCGSARVSQNTWVKACPKPSLWAEEARPLCHRKVRKKHHARCFDGESASWRSAQQQHGAVAEPKASESLPCTAIGRSERSAAQLMPPFYGFSRQPPIRKARHAACQTVDGKIGIDSTGKSIGR